MLCHSYRTQRKCISNILEFQIYFYILRNKAMYPGLQTETGGVPAHPHRILRHPHPWDSLRGAPTPFILVSYLYIVLSSACHPVIFGLFYAPSWPGCCCNYLTISTHLILFNIIIIIRQLVRSYNIIEYPIYRPLPDCCLRFCNICYNLDRKK